MTKSELYNQYKFLILKVMKDLHCQYRTEDEWQDYYDAGQLGLIRAINEYDYSSKKTPFFYSCIKREILNFFHYKTFNKRKINFMLLNSLNKEVGEDTELYELIEDEKVDIERYIIKQEQYETLYKAINMLKPTYKKLICDYYGIGTDSKTFDELAITYKITKQALSVKKNNALKELRKIYKKLEG